MDEKEKTCKHCGESKKNDSEKNNCVGDFGICDAFADAAIEAMDVDSFDAGIREFSCLAGKIAILTAVGVEPSQALAYISECEDRKTTFENNMSVAKMQTEAQVSVAKCGMAATMS